MSSSHHELWLADRTLTPTQIQRRLAEDGIGASGAANFARGNH